MRRFERQPLHLVLAPIFHLLGLWRQYCQSMATQSGSVWGAYVGSPSEIRNIVAYLLPNLQSCASEATVHIFSRWQGELE